MSKTVKLLLAVILTLALILAAIVLVPRYALGIDIFDLSGWKTTGNVVKYLDYHGKPLTGWQTIDEQWYYFYPEDGAMATGWVEVEGKRYYLDKSGVRKSGWLELDEGTYYIDPENMTVAVGWLPTEEGTYYMDQTGRMKTGWLEIGEDRYYLGEDGLRCTGWIETPEGRRYLNESGALCSGWTDTPEGRYYLTEEGIIATGWLETEEGTLYLDDNGQAITGWIELDAGKYYLDESGYITIGWLTLDGDRYYFREDGTMAVGKVVLEEEAFYFASTGKHVELVNTWNAVPEDYEVDLVSYGGYRVAREAYDPLAQMINRVKTVGYYKITSIYRSEDTQQYIWDKRYNKYRNLGYSHDGALEQVRKEVAVPGTSEHHLGLAVDISATDKVHSWLEEHSWEYGFIVRYPEGKTEITGIIHEPWHFRYVGKELAQELYELGLTLEEYMDMLTEQQGTDAGTASNPEIFG